MSVEDSTINVTKDKFVEEVIYLVLYINCPNLFSSVIYTSKITINIYNFMKAVYISKISARIIS